jgi:hypothetical protein
MFLKRTICLVVVFCFLSGCAKKASDISPTYVSPLTYSHYSCDQIRQELIRVNNRVMEVTGQQDSAANKDAVALTVGMVLFWPALFFMVGGDKKEELGRLKGEYEALERSAIEKDCNISEELIESQRQKHEYEEAKRKSNNDSLPADR